MATVLIVESEACLRFLLSINLTSRGYHVIVSESIEKAYEELSACVPDMAVVDFAYHDETIFAFLEQLPAIPIFIMTTLPQSLQQPLMLPNVKRTIQKPFAIHELLELLPR